MWFGCQIGKGVRVLKVAKVAEIADPSHSGLWKAVNSLNQVLAAHSRILARTESNTGIALSKKASKLRPPYYILIPTLSWYIQQPNGACNDPEN